MLKHMVTNHLTLPAAILFITFLSGTWISECTNFTIVNGCKEMVWPAIIPSENISSSGFALKPGQSSVFNVPTDWHGRIWGRTGCSFDSNSNGTCQTGNCGTAFNCSGPGQQPVTIAEFTLGAPDFYDVSLVGGFNLPVIVTPVHGQGNCSTAGCDGDLRDDCPSELAVKLEGKTVACQSACDYFKTDEYCCRGMYGNPESCRATNYSTTFKRVCPAAYSFAYDDPSSIITCSNVSNYIVTFCASRNQTVCMHSDQHLACNRSGLTIRIEALAQIWWVMTLILISMFS